MPTWLDIVLGVFVLLVVVLAVGGAIARKRQLERTRGRFDAHLAQVNHDLAAAHAQDRGWAREALDAAARPPGRRARRRRAEPASLTLVQIVDRPGTDEDKAVFEVDSDGRVRARSRSGAAAASGSTRGSSSGRGADPARASRAPSGSRGSSRATAATASGAGARWRPATAT